MVKIEFVVGVREVGDPAAFGAGLVVNKGRPGRQSRMDGRGGHVDAVGRQGVVKEAALGIEAVEIALAQANADGHLQARAGDQGCGVAGAAGGCAALSDPVAVLLLRIVGHVGRAALGQPAGTDEFFRKDKLRPTEIRHRRIQDQHIDTHGLLPILRRLLPPAASAAKGISYSKVLLKTMGEDMIKIDLGNRIPNRIRHCIRRFSYDSQTHRHSNRIRYR